MMALGWGLIDYYYNNYYYYYNYYSVHYWCTRNISRRIERL